MNGLTKAQHALFSGTGREDVSKMEIPFSGTGREDGGQSGDGVRFERIRRITGYLVGTLDRFNDAKRAEERQRVKHQA